MKFLPFANFHECGWLEKQQARDIIISLSNTVGVKTMECLYFIFVFTLNDDNWRSLIATIFDNIHQKKWRLHSLGASNHC